MLVIIVKARSQVTSGTSSPQCVRHNQIKRQTTSYTIIVDDDQQNIQWYATKNNVSFIYQDRLNLGSIIMSGRTNLYTLTSGVKIVEV